MTQEAGIPAEKQTALDLKGVLANTDNMTGRGFGETYRPGARATYVQREQVRVTIAGHSFVTDHPASVGGDDTGPTPAGLLVSALASCTAVNVGRYAVRKGYAVDSIDIETEYHLRYERIEGPIHAKIFVDGIKSHVKVQGNLTDQQKEDLRFVAQNCPVGNTLKHGLQVEESISWS